MRTSADNAIHASKWEREFGETKGAYLAFCAYRDLGPARSLAKLEDVGAVSVSRRQLERYSSEHGWPQRADAWDIEQERIRRERAGERQAKLDEQILSIAEQGLQAVEAQVKLWNEHGLGRASVIDIARLFDTLVKIARLVMGEVTSINEEKPRTFDQYIRDLAASGYEPSWH